MNRTLLKTQLVRHEGLRLKPYHDTAVPPKLTIGVGRNLDDVGISKEEAQLLLDNDIDRTWNELVKRIPWISSLDDVRQNVLVNMAFNLGVPGLMKFENTLNLVRVGDYGGAAVAMLDSRWAKQVGARAQELSRQMREGKY